MQKILDQQLDGSEETANAKAIYTWEKDEIAWRYCWIYHDVFKVQFTGEHWLSGNKWRYNKIYQYKNLDSSGSHEMKLDPVYKENISHDNEEAFFTTRDEALIKGFNHISKTFNDALADFQKNFARLTEYRFKTEA
jgi:hypothetical protein